MRASDELFHFIPHNVLLSASFPLKFFLCFLSYFSFLPFFSFGLSMYLPSAWDDSFLATGCFETGVSPAPLLQARGVEGRVLSYDRFSGTITLDMSQTSSLLFPLLCSLL